MTTNLKELIKVKGYRKDYIIKRMGISLHTLNNWIRGYTSPTIKQAQQLKEILNLKSIDELIEAN